MAGVLISGELFRMLLDYHLVGDTTHRQEIESGLKEKQESLKARELYGKSKTADSPDEKEQARQEYLDLRGISEPFRW